MTLKFSHVVAQGHPQGQGGGQVRGAGQAEVQRHDRGPGLRQLRAVQGRGGARGAPDRRGSLHRPRHRQVRRPGAAVGRTALPYLFTSDAAAKKLLDPDYAGSEGLFEAMRPKGLLGLGIWGNGWKHFTTASGR